MALDQRSVAILNHLIESPGHVTVQELMDVLRIPKRTIYYDIEKINDWLNDIGLPSIQNVRSKGFYLDDLGKSEIPKRIKSEVTKWHYEYTPQERVAWIGILLLTTDKRVLLQDFIEKNRVSRNTALEDKKKLTQELERFDLQLQFDKKQGYIIKGTEKQKREVLLSFFIQVIARHGWQFLISEIQAFLNTDELDVKGSTENNALTVIYELILDLEQRFSFFYTDDVLFQLCIQMYISYRRSILNHLFEIDASEQEVLETTKEFQAAKFLRQYLGEQYAYSLPTVELYYMTIQLLSAKVNRISNSSDHLMLEKMRELARKMIDDFQRFTGVIFKEQAQLEENLVLHLKPAYYRAKYGIELDNPIVESVKTKYADIFLLTKKVVFHFEEELGKKLDDNEIAFIAIHFGGWLNREGREVKKRHKAIVVCASGLGTSRMLERQLNHLFTTVDIVKTISVREYNDGQFLVDFFVSTTPVKPNGKPVFQVNPILNDGDKAALLKQVQAVIETGSRQESPSVEMLLNTIKKYATVHHEENLIRELKEFLEQPRVIQREAYKPMLNELLVKENIKMTNEVEDWEEAIRLAAQPLLEQQAISSSYIDAMIESVHELGPYIVITPGVALPHARPEAGVHEVGMSFLQVKNGVAFSEKDEHLVKLIFVLAAVDNETHLKALSQLSTMLSAKANIDALMEASSVEEVQKIIHKYSNE